MYGIPCIYVSCVIDVFKIRVNSYYYGRFVNVDPACPQKIFEVTVHICKNKYYISIGIIIKRFCPQTF